MSLALNTHSCVYRQYSQYILYVLYLLVCKSIDCPCTVQQIHSQVRTAVNNLIFCKCFYLPVCYLLLLLYWWQVEIITADTQWKITIDYYKITCDTVHFTISVQIHFDLVFGNKYIMRFNSTSINFTTLKNYLCSIKNNSLSVI